MRPSPAGPNRRLAIAAALVFAAGVGGQVAGRSPAFALVNESPSVPRGLYLREAGAGVRRGAFVALAQPSSTRAYLGRLGMPAEVRLLKRVAAIRGDRVCRSGDGVQVGDRRVLARPADRRGTALPQWRGCRALDPGEVFLLGDTPGSFDSRYFGPVRTTAIDGVYARVLTW